MTHIPIRPPHRKEEDSVDSWLMSYADMITLLLCFFIIFVSVSEPKQEQLRAVAQGLGGKFGSVELASPFLGVFRSVQGVVEANQMGKEIAVERTTQGVQIELSARTFFQDGQAEFRPDAVPILKELVDAVRQADFADYIINVESYTDDQVVSNPLYPSNWEFTAARAGRIVRYFEDAGIEPKRLKVTGLGSSRPKVPNLDIHQMPIPENREANQRIVLHLERVL